MSQGLASQRLIPSGRFWRLVALLTAIAATSAAQTSVLPFLPGLVHTGLNKTASNGHGFHVIGLTAISPLAALLLAPFWGWLADRFDHRHILVLALVVLALVTAPIGQTSLTGLYALRAIAGIASAAVIPITILTASKMVVGRTEQVRWITWLTAFMFMGDFAGPQLAELSARVWPRAPFLALAGGIAIASSLLFFLHLGTQRISKPDSAAKPALSMTLGLLLITAISGGGLAAIHISLLIIQDPFPLGREAIAGMLSLCGLGMLAAQLFHTRVPWIMTAPRQILGLMAFLLAAALFVLPTTTTSGEVAVAIGVAGWTAATLRLLASFWISGIDRPTGLRLGLQHAAASLGQALAPFFVSLIPAQPPAWVLWPFAWSSLVLAILTPLIIRPQRKARCSGGL